MKDRLERMADGSDGLRGLGPVWPKYLPICGHVHHVGAAAAADLGIPEFYVCNLKKGHDGGHEHGEDDHGESAWQ